MQLMLSACFSSYWEAEVVNSTELVSLRPALGNIVKPAVMAHTFSEFKASLIYVASSRTNRATRSERQQTDRQKIHRV